MPAMRELLGRSAELAALRRLLGVAQGAVVIHGEAGVGKAALAVRALADGPHREGGALGTLSWLPLRRAFPELPAETWTGDADYVAAVVGERVGSQVLLVEDVHWADSGSLAVLDQLVGRVALVMTVRRGDRAAVDVLTRLEAAGATRLDLEPLAPAAAADLVERVRAGLPRAQVADLVVRTGGNPLLIEELTLGGPGAVSLELAVRARCRQLPEPQLEGLALIALARRPLPVAALPDAAGLIASGLLVVDEQVRADIGHALIRDVIGDLVSPQRRVRCHRALAGLLDHPGDVALHLLAAGDADVAHAMAMRAVAESATPGERWQHLATAAESAGADESAALRIQAADAACAAAEPERAGELLEGLAIDGAHGAALALSRATQAFQSGDWDRYSREVSAGLAVAPAGSPEEALLRAREATAALIIDNDAETALSLAVAAVAVAERNGTSIASAKAMVASALSMLEQAGWHSLFAEAIAEARDEGDAYRELSSRLNFTISLTAAGDLELALAEATSLQRRCHQMRLLKKAHSAEICGLVVARYRGDFESVASEAARLLAGTLGPGDRLDTLSALAFGQAEQGLVAEAVVTAEQLGGHPSHQANHHAARLIAYALGGQPARALEEWPRFREAPGNDDYALTEVAPFVAWAAHDLGQELPQRPDTLVGGLYAGVEPELDAIAALAGQRYASARVLFDRAAVLHGERSGPALMCRWAGAEAGRRAGDHDVTTVLAKVRAEAHKAGFRPVTQRCDASLRALGVRSGTTRRSTPGALLSPRERDVAELVAEGLTDRESGARLGLAHRTVQTHVASALAQAGCRHAQPARRPDRGGVTRPLVVVESGKEAVADARGELVALGWSVSSEPLVGAVRDVVVAAEATAANAVLAAVAGHGLLVDARAGREVVDRLCDDLRDSDTSTIGSVILDCSPRNNMRSCRCWPRGRPWVSRPPGCTSPAAPPTGGSPRLARSWVWSPPALPSPSGSDGSRDCLIPEAEADQPAGGCGGELLVGTVGVPDTQGEACTSDGRPWPQPQS